MSEHYAKNIDVSVQVRELKSQCKDVKREAFYVWGAVVVVVIALLVVRGGVEAGVNRFLPSDKTGQVMPVVSYGDVYLPYDERLALATQIAQTLNSLGYRDKDEMLTGIEHYFSPNVLKSYISTLYDAGFFSQMTTFEASYIAKLTPAHEFDGKMWPVVYSEDVCYKPDIMGDSVKAGVDCRYSRGVNRQSETFLFNVDRLVVVKGEPRQIQKFKVRLVLTRVDVALYDKGYLVSEYTEI